MDKLSNLEFFRKAAESGEVPAQGSRFIYPPAIARTLGFRLIEVGPGTATMELMADTEIHANPMGTIHGGVLCDILRDDDKLVAQVSSTVMTLRGDHASGR